jgi:hypothetical protein
VNHASRGLQSGKAFARKLGHQPGKFANMDTSPQRFPKCYQRLRNSSQRTAKVPAIAFNWISALAVPLWHPVAAWIIGLFGVLLFKISSP